MCSAVAAEEGNGSGCGLKRMKDFITGSAKLRPAGPNGSG